MSEPLPPDRLAAVRAALQADRKIEAIKIYREATGVGLAEAKYAVEQLAAVNTTPVPGAASTPVKPTGCFAVMAVLGVLVAIRFVLAE